jgi:hypothetical protein
MRGNWLAFSLVAGHLLLPLCSPLAAAALGETVMPFPTQALIRSENARAQLPLFALLQLRGGSSQNEDSGAQQHHFPRTSTEKCEHPCCKDLNKEGKQPLPLSLVPLGSSMAFLDIARVFGRPVYAASIQTIHGLETGAKWLSDRITSLWQPEANVNLEDVQVPPEFDVLHQFLQRHKETAGHKEITKTVLRQTSKHMKELKCMLEQMGTQVDQAKSWIKECQGNKNVRKLRDELQKSDPTTLRMQKTSQARIMNCWVRVLQSVNTLIEKMKGLVEKSYHIAEEGKHSVAICKEMLHLQNSELEALNKALKEAGKQLNNRPDKQQYRAAWDKWLRQMYQNKNELSDLIKRAYCDIEAMKKVALKACGGLESLGKLEDLVLDDIDEMLLEFHQMEKEEEMAPLCV